MTTEGELLAVSVGGINLLHLEFYKFLYDQVVFGGYRHAKQPRGTFATSILPLLLTFISSGAD